MKYKFQVNYTDVVSGNQFQIVNPSINGTDLVTKLQDFIKQSEDRKIVLVQFAVQPLPA